MALAYFPFYPADWLSSASVKRLPREARSMYLDLLCYMWQEKDCSLPSEITDLCAILDTDRSPIVQRIVDTTMQVSDDGARITNARLKMEHDKANDIYQKQVNGGIARAKSMWGKKNPSNRSPNRSPNRSGVASADRSPTPNQNQNQNQNQKEKNIYLRFVLLTKDEEEKLREKLTVHFQIFLDRLDGYIGQIGTQKAAKYKSHYDTILNWWRKDIAEGKISGTTASPQAQRKCPNCGSVTWNSQIGRECNECRTGEVKKTLKALGLGKEP